MARSCSNYAFGYTPGQLVSSTSSPSISPSGNRRVCGCPDDGVNQPVTETNIPACPGGGPPVCETVYSYDTSCSALAQQSKDQVDGRVPRNLITVQSTSNVVGSGVIQCGNTLTYPGPATGTNGDICGYAQINNVCRHPANKLADNQSECGPISIRYSSRGLSRDGLMNEVNAGYAVNPPNASCLSCDELPASTPSQISAKYTCLQNTLAALPSLPATFDKAAIRIDVVKRLKLLFELHGHLLSGGEQSAVQNLYYTDRAAAFQCAAPFSEPQATGACVPADAATTNAGLEMCHRLSASYVAPQVAKAVLYRCAYLAQTLSQKAATCPHVKALNSEWKALFQKQLSFVEKTGTPALPSFNETQLQLVFLDYWFTLQRQYIDFSAASDAEIWLSTSDMLGVFWKGLSDDVLISRTGQYLPQGEKGFGDGLALDRAVALAAATPYDTQWPARGGLAPVVFSDMFHSLGERLEDFHSFHDMACMVRECAPTTSTEVVELWKLLAALPDETKLNAALANTPALDAAPAARKQWKEVFTKLSQNHVQFRNAVLSLLQVEDYTPALLTQSDVTQLPPPLVKLARLIQKGQAATDSYAASGLLGAQAQRVLKTGIQEAKRNELDALVDARKNQWRTAVERYTANRTQYVQSLVAEIGNASSQNNLKTQLGLKLKYFEQLSEDMAGLSLNTSQDAQTLADAARAFETVLLRETENPSTLGMLRSQRALTVSAANARFTPGALSVSAMAVVDASAAPFKVSVKKGDFVTMSVGGQWNPTCSLSQFQLSVPFASPPATAPVNVNGALTGPEGFLLSFQNGAFTAKANRTEEATAESASGRVCAGARAQGGSEFLGNGATAYVYAEGCLSAEKGTRASESADTGTESRISAAFSTGLRVPNTPFPLAPVGSLLAVTVDSTQAGAPLSAVTDIQVVTRNTVLLARQDADVYLVVNDAQLSGCAPDATQSLGIELNHLVSTGTAAKAMSQAWAETEVYFAQAMQNALAQTRLSAQEAVALRAWAYAKLSEKNQGGSLAAFPEEFKSLFDLSVSKSLAAIERKVQAKLLSRDRASVVAELKGLQDDVALAGQQGRFLSLVPLWSLRNLDAENLRWEAKGLFSLVQGYLIPVLDIRYPSALAQLKSDATYGATHPVNKLLFADWTQPYVDTARLGLGVIDAVVAKLGAVRLTDPNPAYVLVALSFPRPPGGGRPAAAASVWKKVSPDRAARLWTTLESTGKADLSILPDDLYVAAGGAAGLLQCIESTPVIHSLALFFARPGSEESSDDLNQQFISGSLGFAPAFEFTQETGIKRYFLDNPNWLVAAPRVLFGPANKALGKFETYEVNLPPANQKLAADGLSPFFSSQIDVSLLRQRMPSPLTDATELIVVMQVDRRTVAGMSQPAACIR